jgi:hypothetical protein
MKKFIKAAAIALPFAFGAVQAKADVLELALLIDGSGSISSSDFALQQNAYVNLLNNNFWTTFGEPSIFDSVLIGVWEFAANVQFIGEQLVDSNADAAALAAVISGNTQNGGTTNTGGAITVANSWFNSNAVTGRRTIDISTDGFPNTGPDAITAANAVRAEGGIVNAIGVGTGVNAAFLTALTSPNGFFETADTFAEFEATLAGKFEREITEVPVPGTLALLASSLLGFGALRRRRKA